MLRKEVEQFEMSFIANCSLKVSTLKFGKRRGTDLLFIPTWVDLQSKFSRQYMTQLISFAEFLVYFGT